MAEHETEQEAWAKDHEYRVWVYEDGTAALDRPGGREYLDEDQARYLLRAIAYATCINTKAEQTVAKP
jgi:nicotinamidase-related amidase